MKRVVGAVVLLLGLLLVVFGLTVRAQTPTPTVVADSGVLQYQNPLHAVDVTFVQTSTVAGAVDMYGMGLMAIQMPASWVTANLTFQASSDCSTYQNLYDRYGSEYTVTTAASRYVIMTPQDFAGIRCLKVRSGTNTTPVTQTASVDLTLLMRPF